MSNEFLLQAGDMPITFSLPQLTEKLKVEHGVKPMAMSLFEDRSIKTVIADTMGWDTVYAIRVPDANAAIASKKASPKSFDQIFEDPDAEIEVAITGSFGHWAIGTGGDGQNLHMEIPITKGIFKTKKKEYALDNCKAIITVKLQNFPIQKPEAPSKDGSKHDLKLKATGTPTDPIVSIISFIFPEGAVTPSELFKAVLQGAFRKWFNENILKFEHVFSAVNINLLASQANLQWLRPTYTSYAYSDHKDPRESFFAVLCMTSRRSAEHLTHSLSPASIIQDQRAGFLISRSLFVEKSILPGLPHAFEDAHVDNFKMINGNTEIVNVDGATLKLKNSDLTIGHTTYVEKFDIKVSGQEIVTTMETRVKFMPGVDIKIYTTTYQKLKLVNKLDGTQTIGYEESRSPESRHEIIKEPWVVITGAIISGVLEVVSMGVGALAKKVVVRIVVIVISFVIGVLISLLQNIIIEVLADGIAKGMPSVVPMIYAATDPFKWPTADTNFKLTKVQLNASVQFGGDPNFKP